MLGSEFERETGTARVYVRSGTTWSLDRELVTEDLGAGDRFGINVALEGEIAIVAPQVSRAYVYRFGSEFPSFCDASDQTLAACPRAAYGSTALELFTTAPKLSGERK